MSLQAIALNRLGLGARRGEPLPDVPRRWLADCIASFDPRPPAIAAASHSRAVAERFLAEQRRWRDTRRSMGDDVSPDNPAAALAREAHREQASARFAAAIDSRSPFVEHLVHFWSNHFAVSADKPALQALAGTLELEAIRPNVLGRFADMLLAVERHPAMQVYLDQARSVGPNSRTGQKARSRSSVRPVGLNENLAREILELHTVGTTGGYAQSDVLELARALTGWTVGGFGRGSGIEDGRFGFRWGAHEPGDRRLLGRLYPHAGIEQGEAMLRDLAAHPSTARHVAVNLARHFVADEPPPSLVAGLARAFEASGGDLPTVYGALLRSEATWSASAGKFKSPWEWLVSAARGLGLSAEAVDAHGLLADLGQPVWRPRSPAGWGDVAPDWASSSALYQRAQGARAIARRAADLDASEAAASMLPGSLGRRSVSVVARGGSPTERLALLLCAPEFLRR